MVHLLEILHLFLVSKGHSKKDKAQWLQQLSLQTIFSTNFGLSSTKRRVHTFVGSWIPNNVYVRGMRPVCVCVCVCAVCACVCVRVCVCAVCACVCVRVCCVCACVRVCVAYGMCDFIWAHRVPGQKGPHPIPKRSTPKIARNLLHDSWQWHLSGCVGFEVLF